MITRPVCLLCLLSYHHQLVGQYKEQADQHEQLQHMNCSRYPYDLHAKQCHTHPPSEQTLSFHLEDLLQCLLG
uniref:Secreted protein n=1 Tax=Arundo donax TaxID=35708 RepID=A0A0A9EC59_ARUDO